MTEIEIMKTTRQHFFEDHGQVVETIRDYDEEYEVEGIRYTFADKAMWTECENKQGLAYYAEVIGEEGRYEEVFSGFIGCAD